MWSSLSDINLYEGILTKSKSAGVVLSQTDVDFQTICRTCLRQANDTGNLCKDFEIGAMNFNIDGRVLRLIDMFVQTTGLEADETDHLPLQVCNNCIQNISGAYFFRQQCHKADNLLHRLHDAINSYVGNESEVSPIVYKPDEEQPDEEQPDSNDIITPLTTEEEPEIYNEFNDKDMSVEFDGVEYKIDSATYHIDEISESGEAISLSNNEQISIEIIGTEKDLNQEEVTNEPLKQNKPIKRKRKGVPGIDRENLQCMICDAKFTKIQSLQRHVKMHQPNAEKNVCSYCGKEFLRKDDLRRHVRIHTGEKPYACPQCPNKYKQPSELKEHMLTHTSDRCFECKICGKVVKSRNGLYVHNKIHLGIRKHVCHLCGKSYFTNGELNSHIRNVHDKLRPFQCNVESCSRRFPSKSALKVHERVHTGERPFQCGICDKRLATQSSLSHHLRMHKEPVQMELVVRDSVEDRMESTDPLFECTACYKYFLSMKELEEHSNSGACDQLYEQDEIEENEFVEEVEEVDTISVEIVSA